MASAAAPSNGQVDLLVIGGGITGAAVARDAVMRGLSVMLVEQGDFASGTSSRTSKLIHGGLRYLEHGYLHLVFEACRERATLLRTAPHLVRPLDFLIPIFAGDSRSRLTIRAGLALYDLLAIGRAMRTHRMLSVEEVVAREPRLRREGLVGGALYTDCQMQDARLCVEIMLDAERRGAICRNGVQVERIIVEGGRTAGAVVTDERSGVSEMVAARAVVNATGPWADRLLQQTTHTSSVRRLRPTKGSHLVLPKRIGEDALLLSARQDGRVVFAMPWHEQMLVGTTETSVDGVPQDVRIETREVRYLLDVVNRVFVGDPLTEEDVLATFAGLRPLVDQGGVNANAASREHLIVEEPTGCLHALGGKYTTHRAIAEAVVDRVIRRLRRRDPGCQTATASLWGLDDAPEAYAERVVRNSETAEEIPADSLRHLAITYGIRHRDIVALTRQDASLGHPLCIHHPHIGAELLYAFQREHARSLVDFMFRRTAITYSACRGVDGLETARSVLVRHLGMSEEVAQRGLMVYQTMLADGLAWRGQVP